MKVYSIFRLAEALSVFVLVFGVALSGWSNPYAESVVDSYILDGNAGNSKTNPAVALGAPDDVNVSMGGPGAWMILDMGSADPVVDGPGADLEIREIGAAFGGKDESYDVYISNSTNLESFVHLGTGRAISLFDISSSGLTDARYVRIVDLATETLDTQTPGSDIDALTSMHSTGLPTGTGVLNAELTCQGILLSWEPVEGADAYYIRRSFNGISYPSTPDTEVDASATGYHDLALPDVTNLWYALTALSNGVESAAAVAEIPYFHFSGPSGPYHLGDNTAMDWDVPDPTNVITFSFSLSDVPKGPIVKLNFDLLDVDYSYNYIFVNGVNVGGLPTQSGEFWGSESMLIESGILKSGTNAVEIQARTSGGALSGSLDDFMIRNVQFHVFGTTNAVALPWVVGYSPTLTPASWESISEPIRWSPNATNETGFFRLQLPD
ncbi:hypothetical protein [Pontiella agarivorans]|uniref:F5/8 type C domain-containing protein n=1 Tax=Pontiella agarivorans TaxID=3038953 RepID=A0ABU5MY68_9BACT|nr:hypothetical protein [Pontiella agarivorans]MDZ8119155.1 hypothetical protein [Pontiella agarivorans]